MTKNPKSNTGGLRPRNARSIALCLAALAVLTVADLWTKEWALETLSRPKVAGTAPPVCAANSLGELGLQRIPDRVEVLVKGHLQLRYTENCAGAFGMFRSSPRWVRGSIFTGAALSFMGLLFWTYVRGSGGRMFVIGVPLIASGALGNLVDRFRNGYVIDFIRYHGLFEWPTFNVADVAIVAGGVLLLLDGYLSGAQARSTEPHANTAST